MAPQLNISYRDQPDFATIILLIMKRFSVIPLCLFFVVQLWGQEQLGWRLERYAGISGIRLNPASYAASPLRWDVQLFGGSIFFGNNYAFAEKSNLRDLLSVANQDDLVARPLLEADDVVRPDQVVIDFYDDRRNRFAFANAAIEGPSFFVRLNDRHALGLMTAFRLVASGFGVENELSYYPWFNRAEFDPFPVKDFHSGAAGFTEIGLNYVFTTYTANGRLGLGFTAKHLAGYEGAYFDSRSTMSVSKLPENSVSGISPNLAFGFTENAYQNEAWNPKVSGAGFGIDLGMVYTIDEDGENYLCQFGLSVLDIGRIRFDKGAQEHLAKAEGERVLSWQDYRKFESVEEFDQIVRTFSRQILGDSLASFQANSFELKLPTRLALQADVKVNELFYVNGMLVQPAPFKEAAITRGSMLAVTPRFEHRWGSLSLPVSLYNWQQVRIGLAARLGFIVIGTDKIGGTLTRSKFNGADFYFAVKVPPFPGESKGNSGGRSRKIGKRGKNIPCYRF